MAKETGNCLHEPLPRTDTDVIEYMKGIRVLFMAELNPYSVLLETLTVPHFIGKLPFIFWSPKVN
jgi:hypothetical protein